VTAEEVASYLVGVLDSKEGDVAIVIVHALTARAKYLRG